MIVRFSPDGRVFVGEKSGLIKVFASTSATTPTVFADLRTNVHNFWDRGLLGMTLHPNFPTVPYVYVSYTYDHILGDPAPAPRWGTPGATSDSCPTPPGPLTSGCVVSGRVSRMQATGNVAGPEQVLVEGWCQQFPSHSVGAVEFGPDGMLYATGGEGANFSYADYGQASGGCVDPGGGSPPGAEGGALRSQDLRTPADPVGLSGSLIRVNPSTGAGAAGNPLAGSSDLNARRILAYGMRNPFRFAFRPGTSEIWIGDAGWNDWEEINQIDNPTAAVLNFGWPCYEGSSRQAGFDGADLAICETLYSQPSADTKPFFAYRQSDKVVAGESCPAGSSSVSGLSFEFAATGGTFPPEYQGALFFADYSRRCIWAMVKNGTPKPSPGSIRTFVADASDPVNLEFGPDGSLYYVDFNGGTIKRVSYGVPPSGGPTFNPPVSYSTGTNAHGVTTANLNGDGKLDLAVANSGASSVSVMLGNGDGSFGTPSNFSVGSQPKSVTATDFNDDGKVDLATANQGSNTVSILLGNGSGSFTSAGSHAVCPGTHEVAPGEFNGDGRPDLAVACWGGTVISVLIGNGSGGFGSATNYPAGSAPTSLAVHDYNRDGRHDLAIANNSGANVSILMGNGNGTFAAPVNYATGVGPHSIRTGDFNGDGIVDLVTANDGSSNVTLLRGVGNGTFTGITSYPTGSVPKGVAVGDLNGDGKLDVATANTAGRYPSGNSNPGGDQISILLGSGTGTLGAPTNHQVGNTPFAVAVGRLDGDGKPDLVSANWFSHNASVLLTSGTGPPPPPPGTQYLGDIAWTQATNGWGPVERNLSNGEAAAGDGSAITLNSVTFAKGLGVHAASDVRYAISSCTRFKASIGVDDEVGADGSVVFEVYAGAAKIYDSGVMTGTTATRAVDVDISGATELRLIVDTNGSDRADHADWADARIECGADTTPPSVSQRAPAPGAVGVATSVSPTATFSEAMNATTLTTSTFTLVKQGLTTPVAASITYAPATRTATLDPTVNLDAGAIYTATVKGGASGVKDVAGNPLAGDVTWSFTTASGGGSTTYVSDMTWTQATNGWGPVEKDMSNGESAAGDGRTITLNGITYSKGLGIHAVSDVRYAISNCSRFKASVGVDDEVGSAGSVVFQVFAGATQIYTSGAMTGTTATKQVDVAIAGATELRLVVGNSNGSNHSDHADWADARVECGGGQGNQPPVPTIATPSPSVTWKVGDSISFSGSATDPDQGSLPASALTWTLLLQHCPSNCHSHTVQSWPGVASGSFSAPDHEHPSYLDLQLTATDAQGLQGTTTVRLNPQTVVLSFASSPSGLQLTVGPDSATTPFTRTVIIGSANSISAPSPQALSGTNYTFSSWSDGGAQTHNITAPASPATYTATYTGGGGPPPGTYVSDLTPTQATNGYGPVEKDKSNGEDGAGDGNTITLNSVTYTKGLGVHAASDVRYSISGCSRFKADVGVDDEVGANGSVVFQVFAGATKVYDSGTMTGATATKPVDVSISGATLLRLVVTGAGDGVSSDHGDWANARIECSADTTPPTVTGRTPAPGATGVAVGVSPTATFSEPMNASTLTTSTFTLVRQGETTPVGATVSYNAGSATATLDPSTDLQASTTYTATVKGGASGAKDNAGNPLASDVTWTFTTGGGGGPTTTFVSDLTWTQQTNGWGPVERDQSNGEDQSGDGETITLNGVTYAKGVGTHAGSDVRFAVSNCTRFKASVGIDDEVSLGTVVFEVYNGSTKIYDSGTMNSSSATKQIDVAITGATELRLVVTDAGDGNGYDHADWANARVECG